METKTLTKEEAVEYKQEAPNMMYLNRFIDSLKEMEDQETLDVLK